MLQITNEEQDNLPEQRNCFRGNRVYTCSDCKYESNRLFNVQRHKERIHVKCKVRYCCGQKFVTKGNYYIHCEKKHPGTRLNTITSRTKYKITRDMVATINDEELTRPYNGYRRKNSYKVKLERRYSQRIRLKEKKAIESEVSLSYSITYSDMENMPLISFLTDRKLKQYLKGLTESELLNNNNNKSEEHPMEIAISPEQNIEKARPDNGDLNVEEVSHSTVAAISRELPAKKLILHRFRTSVIRKFGVTLWDQNNNVPGQVNFTENRDKDAVPSRQRPSMWWPDKENVPTFAFSVEQLRVKLDTGIAVQDFSQVHRDFLEAIDFDKYKIF